MKVTLNVDCTPVEAREFLGLPDLRPIQSAILEKLEGQLSASLDRLSPDAVLQRWLFFGAEGSTRIQDLFDGFFGRAGRDGATDKKTTQP